MGIFLWYDQILKKAKEKGESWAVLEESRRLPLACIGGPLLAISQFWLVSFLFGTNWYASSLTNVTAP